MREGRWVRWLLSAAAWTLAALIFASLEYFTAITVNQPDSYLNTLFWNAVALYIFAALFPIILKAARSFPIEKGRWMRAVLIHASLNVLLSVAHLIIFVLLYWLIGGRRLPQSADAAAAFDFFKLLFFSNLPTNLMINGLLLVGALAVDYYRRYQKGELQASELRAELAQAQLQALKMQLHPHFLFNTLNAIAELVYRDPEAAETMLTQLSEMLRISLDTVGVQLVPLKQELEFLQKYLEIEQTRFQERLRVEMKIDPQSLDASVPNMILQPIVENAIRHGISPLSRGGHIEIKAAREDGMLLLRVHDDGRGLRVPDEGASVQKRGLGLSNTRARLERLYGAGAYKFELTNAPGRGLTVRIVIPFRESLPEVSLT